MNQAAKILSGAMRSGALCNLKGIGTQAAVFTGTVATLVAARMYYFPRLSNAELQQIMEGIEQDRQQIKQRLEEMDNINTQIHKKKAQIDKDQTLFGQKLTELQG
ncbi:hypothetical protein Tsubulata_049328 [Turnera subulata]|uniref:Uncharacterized protein n=1 Tax=Turnera subulata TaxID=218843 RepID=A0A9Q0JQW4_9ROSI|nr:hypothetical protein Tsubulata_049328 [Turnera subulata]